MIKNDISYVTFCKNVVLYICGNYIWEGGVSMTKEEIQKKLDELGIVSIEASGDLSSNLITDAIKSTEKLMSNLDLSKLAKEINKAEKVYH